MAIYLDIKNDIVLTAPAPTQLIYDSNGYFLSESNVYGNEELGYWSVPDPIPEKVKNALLYAEDHRFYQHLGVDSYALFRAIGLNMIGRPRQGASTIAMQVARMQGHRTRTYWNKLCEIAIAAGLIQKFGHKAVLAQYLKLMPQGNRIHGITYSARRYFKKPLNDLNWAEVALLTALPKAPGKMNLFTASGFQIAKKRAAWILNRLKTHKVITLSEFEKADYLLHQIYLPVKEERPYNSYHAILKIEQAIKSAPKTFSMNQPIISSLDLRLQDHVESLAESFLNYYRFLGAGNIAVIVIDLKTHGIRSYLGSIDYGDAQFSGSIDYNDTQRSSGSILKPFVFAQGLDSGHFTPRSILIDEPLSIRGSFGILSINNYDHLYLGPLLYRKALANSRNVPAVQILKKTGLDEMLTLFRQLKLVEPSIPKDYYGLGMAIGGIYITLKDLMNAYGTLAMDGHPFSSNWFEHQPSKLGTQPIIKPHTARLIKLFLSDPQARLPSFPRMGNLEYPFNVAVKTGTSQGFRDAWTVAFSSDYMVGTWIGHPDNTPMKKVSGVAIAALAKQILLGLDKDKPKSNKTDLFQPPKTFFPVKICASTGSLNIKNCHETVTEYLHQTQLAKQTDTLPVLIDSRTGLLANENTPAMALKKRVISLNAPTIDGMDTRSPLNSGVTITLPLNGAKYIIDPSIPLNLQTIPFKAVTTPAIPKLDWFINGLKMDTSAPPHNIRWRLKPGKHKLQAGFPNANIKSEIVEIEVRF